MEKNDNCNVGKLACVFEKMLENGRAERTVVALEKASSIEEREAAAKRVVDHLLVSLGLIRNPNDEVYCGDLVLVSIDGKTAKKYLIASNRSERLSSGRTYDDNLDLVYDSIPWYGNLAAALIGSYVGDIVEYTDENDHELHSVRVIATSRTKYSEKINVEAEMDNVTAEKLRLTDLRCNFLDNHPEYLFEKRMEEYAEVRRQERANELLASDLREGYGPRLSYEDYDPF